MPKKSSGFVVKEDIREHAISLIFPSAIATKDKKDVLHRLRRDYGQFLRGCHFETDQKLHLLTRNDEKSFKKLLAYALAVKRMYEQPPAKQMDE